MAHKISAIFEFLYDTFGRYFYIEVNHVCGDLYSNITCVHFKYNLIVSYVISHV